MSFIKKYLNLDVDRQLNRLCQINPSFRITLRKYFFYYDAKLGLAYCHIPKVASLTWNRRFKELASTSLNSASKAEVRKYFQLPNKSQKELLNLLNSENVTSFIYFRHPLSRLVSFYRHKVGDVILNSYRLKF